MSYGVSKDQIDEIIAASKEKIWYPFPTVTVMALELPDGFVITSSSACVDPDDFDLDIGIDICRQNIYDEVWKFEAYKNKQKWYEEVCKCRQSNV